MRNTIYNKSQVLMNGLHLDDSVVFNLPSGDSITYNVYSYFLGRGGSNFEIFSKLGMSRERANKFCELAYGYPMCCGCTDTSFPECKSGDYDALVRVVVAIYDLIEAQIPPSTSYFTSRASDMAHAADFFNTSSRGGIWLNSADTSIVPIPIARKSDIGELVDYPTTREMVTAINALIKAYNSK